MSLETELEQSRTDLVLMPLHVPSELLELEQPTQRANLAALLPSDFSETQFYNDVEQGYVSLREVLGYVGERLGEMWTWRPYVRENFTGHAAYGKAIALKSLAEQRLTWLKETYGTTVEDIDDSELLNCVATWVIEDAHAKHDRLQKEGLSQTRIEKDMGHLFTYLRETPEEDRLEDVKTRLQACAWYAQRSVDEVAEAYEQRTDPNHRLHDKATARISNAYQRLSAVMNATLQAMNCDAHRISGKGRVDYAKLREFAQEVHGLNEPLSPQDVQDLWLQGQALVASYSTKGVFEHF